ncbi:uncharacterized protein LTR77_010155 [Saxophila tyrrhenica]|uniref:Uncharacterized protein n=1 Tax=Saxophila tyrrhenica TaxID=1690608 RepID=A0AAV9NW05_9PEZI|nr:hypothetical protein LTR77_010155 [Saxophila tyrrhenica]
MSHIVKIPYTVGGETTECVVEIDRDELQTPWGFGDMHAHTMAEFTSQLFLKIQAGAKVSEARAEMERQAELRARLEEEGVQPMAKKRQRRDVIAPFA